MKSKEDTIPLEHWIGYRFGLITARLGKYVAQMYTSRHDLTVPVWRSLAVIARYQPLTAKQLANLTSSDAFKVEPAHARDGHAKDGKACRLKVLMARCLSENAAGRATTKSRLAEPHRPEKSEADKGPPCLDGSRFCRSRPASTLLRWTSC
jgi:hypothetical protein